MPPEPEKKSKPNTFPESMSLNERIQYCQDMLAVREELRKSDLKDPMVALIKSDKPSWPSKRSKVYEVKKDPIGKLFNKKMKLHIQKAYYGRGDQNLSPRLRGLINKYRTNSSLLYYLRTHVFANIFGFFYRRTSPFTGHRAKVAKIEIEMEHELYGLSGSPQDLRTIIKNAGLNSFYDDFYNSATTSHAEVGAFESYIATQKGSRPLPELKLLPKNQTEAQKEELDKADEENQLTQQIMDLVSLYDDPELEMAFLDKLVYETKMQYFLEKNILSASDDEIEEIIMPENLGEKPENTQSLRTQVKYYQTLKQGHSVESIPPEVKDAIKSDKSVKIIRDNTQISIYDSTDQSTTLVTSKKEADSYLNQVNEDLQKAAKNVRVDLKMVEKDQGMKMALYKEIFQPDRPKAKNLASKGMFDPDLGEDGMDRLKLHFLETYSTGGIHIPQGTKETLRSAIAGRNSEIKNKTPPVSPTNATELHLIAQKAIDLKGQKNTRNLTQ